MRNYRMLLSYDGSGFRGWQRLAGGEKTIQGILEDTIEELTGESVEVVGSGRTDAGVHAREQVANFKVMGCLLPDFREKMNQTLPDEIRVLRVDLAADGFHSRHHAIAKTYKYYVDTNERPRVFERRYLYHLPQRLSLDAMKQAAEYLKGRFDFSSFTDDRTERSKVREIRDIRIHETDGRIEFVYEGDGFLYHMVRILTGTLLEVGLGLKKAEDMPLILKAKVRSQAGHLVPAKGLFLEKVYYS